MGVRALCCLHLVLDLGDVVLGMCLENKMCMPLGDYLKDFNTLYMAYCVRGFFIRLGGALTPGLMPWWHPHM